MYVYMYKYVRLPISNYWGGTCLWWLRPCNNITLAHPLLVFVLLDILGAQYTSGSAFHRSGWSLQSALMYQYLEPRVFQEAYQIDVWRDSTFTPPRKWGTHPLLSPVILFLKSFRMCLSLSLIRRSSGFWDLCYLELIDSTEVRHHTPTHTHLMLHSSSRLILTLELIFGPIGDFKLKLIKSF